MARQQQRGEKRVKLGGTVPKYFSLLSVPAIEHTGSPLLYTVAGLSQRPEG